MDFIERIFDVAPDDGSGNLEFVILVSLGALLLGLLYRIRSSRRPNNSSTIQVATTAAELSHVRESKSLEDLAKEVGEATHDVAVPEHSETNESQNPGK